MKSTFQLQAYYDESFLPNCRSEFELNLLSREIDFTIYNILGYDIMVYRRLVMPENQKYEKNDGEQTTNMADANALIKQRKNEKISRTNEYKVQNKCRNANTRGHQFTCYNHPNFFNNPYSQNKAKDKIESLFTYPGLKLVENKTPKIVRHTAKRSKNVIPITSLLKELHKFQTLSKCVRNVRTSEWHTSGFNDYNE
ncbi:hypothetical protein EWB00_005935 [Schistosoma japonicum]|uniref:Uncharacterized protein n=1 Tax=Schistosoma japonicum TaxID=6182 RepID=A0A4Z2D069_SCHJA|nr:hypothetical protein EWB00_005935 [Schistosoma japonicum]